MRYDEASRLLFSENKGFLYNFVFIIEQFIFFVISNNLNQNTIANNLRVYITMIEALL